MLPSQRLHIYACIGIHTLLFLVFCVCRFALKRTLSGGIATDPLVSIHLPTWVILWLVALAVSVLFVPVQNAANEGRDESDLSLGTSHCLGEREQQGHVAVDPMLLLQLPGKYTCTKQTNQDVHDKLYIFHRKC